MSGVMRSAYGNCAVQGTAAGCSGRGQHYGEIRFFPAMSNVSAAPSRGGDPGHGGPSELLEQQLMDNLLDLCWWRSPTSPPAVRNCMGTKSGGHCPRRRALPPRSAPVPGGIPPTEIFAAGRGSGTREEFERVTERAGFTVSPHLGGHQHHRTGQCGHQRPGDRGAALPYGFPPLERGLVSAVTVEGLDFRRKFRIVYHRDKFLTTQARDFIALCRSCEAASPPQYPGLC